MLVKEKSPLIFGSNMLNPHVPLLHSTSSSVPCPRVSTFILLQVLDFPRKFLVLRTVLRNIFSMTGSFRNVIAGLG